MQELLKLQEEMKRYLAIPEMEERQATPQKQKILDAYVNGFRYALDLVEEQIAKLKKET